jgi:hypothetical protein
MAKNYTKQSHSRSRNQSGNNIYSINYRFDSISIAGKHSGNALDLIKKYNELAKEAFGEHDIVKAETFRQYAEHYRKIVTDINEKRNQRNNNQKNKNSSQSENTTTNLEVAVNNAEPKVVEVTENAEKTEKKSGKLKIVEIKSSKETNEEIKPAPKKRGRPAGSTKKASVKKEEVKKEAS